MRNPYNTLIYKARLETTAKTASLDAIALTGTAFAGNRGDHWDDWTYNERNELTASERYERGTGFPPPTTQPIAADDFEYVYDNIGNRESSTLDDPPAVTTYTSNPLNQYTATSQPSESFTHDEDGNMTAGGSRRSFRLTTGRRGAGRSPGDARFPAAGMRLTITTLAGGILLVALAGCAASRSHRDALDRYGRIFYLDGAGADLSLLSKKESVRTGLVATGYRGAFSLFVWNTGFGVIADEIASVEFKRKKAAQLAHDIVNYLDSNMTRPVHLIAQSAGTAIATFTLEALPTHYQVDNVVFMGSALDGHYDLTKALQHVRGRLYVFMSDNDLVLRLAVPLTGTADRQYCGACAAGLRGFHMPVGARDGTRRQYAKVENINWRPEFAGAGNRGGHTDAVNAAFVRQYVAPLLWPQGPRFVETGVQPMQQEKAEESGHEAAHEEKGSGE